MKHAACSLLLVLSLLIATSAAIETNNGQDREDESAVTRGAHHGPSDTVSTHGTFFGCRMTSLHPKTSSVHLRDSTVALATSFVGTLDSSWSNETWALYLCGNLTSEVTAMTWNLAADISIRWLLPDCFFGSSASLNALQLRQFILTGSAAEADPISRLGAAFPALTGLTLEYGAFYYVNGSPYSFDWNIAFNNLPNVRQWGFSSIPLNCDLPSSLPSPIYDFTMTYTGLTGTIPSGLLTNQNAAPTFTLALSYNSLEGTIPPSLFSGVKFEAATLGTFVARLDGNKLTGPIPENLFEDRVFAGLTSFTLSMSTNKLNGSAGAWMASFRPTEGKISVFVVQLDGNKLSSPMSSSWFPPIFSNAKTWQWIVDNNELAGTIPSDLFSNCVFPASGTYFVFLASNNLITGPVPTSIISLNSASVNYVSFIVDFSQNQLSGTLPSGLWSEFGSNTFHLELNLAENQISGTIPSDLLLVGPSTSPAPLSQVQIYLDNNKFTGALPANLFSFVSWDTMGTLILSLNQNLISGDLPATLLSASTTPMLFSLKVSMDDNPNLNGTIPASFLASINPTVSGSTGASSTISLSFSRTALTGSLTIPNFSARNSAQSTSLSLSFANANLRRISIEANAASILSSLDLSNNHLLTGTLPAGLFSSPSIITKLWAGNTALGGTLPEVSSIQFLNLSSTFIDFCSSSVILTATNTCDLDFTTASQCPATFPVCSKSAVVSTPATTVSCPIKTRPSLDYVCVGSTWTFYGNVTTPTLTIPSGGATTTIIGSVESTSIILGRASTLTIQNGCASNLTEVTIQLELNDLDLITNNSTQTLISIDTGSSCTNLSSIVVNAKVNGKSCKKVTTNRIETSSQLTALFVIDSSDCKSNNTWWIVLVAVLVPIVVAVLIVVLLVLFVRPVRECVRPHSKKRPAGGQLNGT